MMLGTVVAYFLLWVTPAGIKTRGFEDRQFAQLCAAKAADPTAKAFKVSISPGVGTYAVMCNTPRCAEPPATVTISPVVCERIPAHPVTSIEPERWEEGKAP